MQTKAKIKKKAIDQLNEIAPKFGYKMTLLEEGIYELIRKKATRKDLDEEDLDSEAEDLFNQEGKSEEKKVFFDVLRQEEMLKYNLFFFESVYEKSTNDIIFCMWDFDFHSPRQ